jgi:hypothetical protein
MQMQFVLPRNVWETAGGQDVPARERRTDNGGHFVDALRVRKLRRRSDTRLPPIPLSELPTLKALLVAPDAVESKPFRVMARVHDEPSIDAGDSRPFVAAYH